MVMKSQTTPQTPHRRPRVSSSGSETDTPLRKRQNIEKLENMANLTLKEVNLTDLYSLMLDMKTAQDEMKKNQEHFQITVQTQITALESKIDTKMDSVHRHIEKEINEVKLEMMQEKEKHDEQMRNLQSQVSRAETEVKKIPKKSSDEYKLIFKNIKQENISDIEDLDSVKLFIDNIIKEIEVDTESINIEILNRNAYSDNSKSNGPQRRARSVISVYFPNDEDRKQVLKNKRKLKNIEKLSHIYIEVDKTRYERQTEANLRKIIKTVPTLRMRGGKIINVPNENNEHGSDPNETKAS